MKILLRALCILALAAIPAISFADADLDALRSVALAPRTVTSPDNVLLYAQTAASLRNIQARVAGLYQDGQVDYYRLRDFTDRLRDASYRADLYFRALREQETGSKFASAARRAQLLGELRQAVDRMVARLPR